MTKRTLLIDSDILAYQFAAKSQRKYAFGTAVDDLDEVTPRIDEWLMDLKEDLKATDLIICLSCPSDEGWRKDIYPAYKDNRKGTVRPELLMPLKDYLEKAYPSYRRPRLEADDIMGILSTHPKLVAGEKVIVSEDKDLMTIPGLLFNPRKDSKPRRISEEEANYRHLYQTLVGDTTDGYPGCPKVGPVGAERILRWAESDASLGASVWERVVEAFEERGLSESDALVQARVARICRHTDYDFKTKKVIPWTPDSSPPRRSSSSTASTAATTSSKDKPSTASTRSGRKTAAKS